MGKREMLGSVLDQIKRRYGEGSIMWLGDAGRLEIERIPTGSLALDIALGIGGVPRGRIVEIFGPEASGKTTLALHLIAQAQALGGTAAFIDAEHALDPNYASVIGVELENLLLSQPSSGEQALEITEQLVRSGALDIIVIDSVAALVPQAEIAGAMGSQEVGLQARLMSQAMRKLSSAIGQTRTTVVFINQIRSKINATPWGPTTTTSGGLALKFYTSIRMEIRRIGNVESAGEKIGSLTRVRVVKNKLAPPFKEAECEILWGKGIVRTRDLIRTAERLGIVQRRGQSYTYGDVALGQGIEGACAHLEGAPSLAQEIEVAALERAGLTRGGQNGRDRRPDGKPAGRKPKRRKER